MTNGRKRGAVIGAVLFLAAALGPGISLGSYAALILLSHLTGGAVEPGGWTTAMIAAGALTGAVSAGAIGITAGSLTGAAAASGAGRLRSSLRSWDEDRVRRRKPVTVLPQGGMAADIEADVRSRITFLDGLRGSLRSIVVVGSAAHGWLDERSDRDVVLICRKEDLAAVQNALFEQELSDGMLRRECRMEYTLLQQSDACRLFRQASPFAYALRYGAVLHDDGFLRGLLAGSSSPAPGRKYCFSALYENILVPYYGSFRAAERDARAKGCTADCCGGRPDCPGLLPADMPATVIMRMLYVTLPVRGYIPLSKRDVILFVRRVYGTESTEIAERAASLSRNGGEPYRYDDHVRFRRLAGSLFREILSIVGSTGAVRGLLADAASIVQGRYGQVKDPALRACVRVGAGTGRGRT